MPIPVICDRCRSTGNAGEADFSHLGDLLEFEPVPRKHDRVDGWNAERQRAFIAALAATGSKRRAAMSIGMAAFGVDQMLKAKGNDSFRLAYDRAMAIAKANGSMKIANGIADAAARQAQLTPPSRLRGAPLPGLPGQILNERGEWEDKDSLERRAADARDSITRKLLGARRLYLFEIAGCPGKRAAFEILTRLPIDWDRARKLEPQADEPWRKPNLREGDLLLPAENGWLGDIAHGEDKLAELRAQLDGFLAEKGMAPVSWDGDE
jgi:hypothetical protein